MIVAGHRRPDGDDYAVETMIAQTRAYIQDFAAAYEVAKDAEELVATMAAKYPYHGNVWTLQFSAIGAMMLRDAGFTAADIPALTDPFVKGTAMPRVDIEFSADDVTLRGSFYPAEGWFPQGTGGRDGAWAVRRQGNVSRRLRRVLFPSWD